MVQWLVSIEPSYRTRYTGGSKTERVWNSDGRWHSVFERHSVFEWSAILNFFKLAQTVLYIKKKFISYIKWSRFFLKKPFENRTFRLAWTIYIKRKKNIFYIKRCRLEYKSSVFEWSVPQMSIAMPEHSKTEPFEIRTSKCSDLEWIRISDVQYSSPHCNYF